MAYIIFFAVLLHVPEISAEEKEQPKALVIYRTIDGSIDEYQRSFDMLISPLSIHLPTRDILCVISALSILRLNP